MGKASHHRAARSGPRCTMESRSRPSSESRAGNSRAKRKDPQRDVHGAGY
ncbi:hypothetical protein [Azospirillum doebereinerae]